MILTFVVESINEINTLFTGIVNGLCCVHFRRSSHEQVSIWMARDRTKNTFVGLLDSTIKVMVIFVDLVKRRGK